MLFHVVGLPVALQRRSAWPASRAPPRTAPHGRPAVPLRVAGLKRPAVPLGELPLLHAHHVLLTRGREGAVGMGGKRKGLPGWEGGEGAWGSMCEERQGREERACG